MEVGLAVAEQVWYVPVYYQNDTGDAVQRSRQQDMIGAIKSQPGRKAGGLSCDVPHVETKLIVDCHSWAMYSYPWQGAESSNLHHNWRTGAICLWLGPCEH